MDRDLPRHNEIWRHFKNKLYRIVTTAQHTETGEQMVVYRAMYGEEGDFVRPLDMFMSEVDRKKYPDVEQEYRFVRIE
ncbi:MAG: DUF1653 domain-containing protein [Anaerovibrio sp.]|uniref:DUF1653 domain-containing protein n=1 Tax=Anaerovibrio sp. TaxID=1872532 RepID=UPI0025F08A0A|nr:DUF1653 domain-containing protein [Anaerovibrio sp.]MCR5175567.1 DUF1653 domain-containing protein [Anaerovibrio sp.]